MGTGSRAPREGVQIPRGFTLRSLSSPRRAAATRPAPRSDTHGPRGPRRGSTSSCWARAPQNPRGQGTSAASVSGRRVSWSVPVPARTPTSMSPASGSDTRRAGGSGRGQEPPCPCGDEGPRCAGPAPAPPQLLRGNGLAPGPSNRRASGRNASLECGAADASVQQLPRVPRLGAAGSREPRGPQDPRSRSSTEAEPAQTCAPRARKPRPGPGACPPAPTRSSASHLAPGGAGDAARGDSGAIARRLHRLKGLLLRLRAAAGTAVQQVPPGGAAGAGQSAGGTEGLRSRPGTAPHPELGAPGPLPPSRDPPAPTPPAAPSPQLLPRSTPGPSSCPGDPHSPGIPPGLRPRCRRRAPRPCPPALTGSAPAARSAGAALPRSRRSRRGSRPP